MADSIKDRENGIAPGCHRTTVDLPLPLYDIARERAHEPPAVSVAEYIRRLLAHHLNYKLPSQDDRIKRGLRMDGKGKDKPGPKPKKVE